MALTLCTMCERHVRTSETRCPFCEAEVTARPVAEPRQAPLTRAMAFAAIALAVSCEEKKTEPATPTQASATASTTAAVTASTTAAASTSVAPTPSVTDASVPDAPAMADAHEPMLDAPKPAVTVLKKPPPPPPPNLAKPYGAPPADGLLV